MQPRHFHDLSEELEEAQAVYCQDYQADYQAWRPLELLQHCMLLSRVTSLMVLSSATDLCGDVSMSPLSCLTLLLCVPGEPFSSQESGRFQGTSASEWPLH